MTLARALLLVAGMFAATGCPPPHHGQASTPAWVSETDLFASTAKPGTRATLAPTYGEVVTKVLEHARKDRGAYAKLAHLTDRIGHRLSGSAALDKAIEWAVRELKKDGHEHVATEPVMVPHWVRGIEEGAITAPVERRLHLIGLGGTVSTPKGGLVAPVVIVRTWAELDAKAAQIKGAIVVFDVAMPVWTEKSSGYGDVAPFRTRGPSRAAKLGAVAVLMRSVTAHSLRTPHTGALNYDPAVPKVPAAAITVEDAQQIARLAANGPVTIRLRLESQQLPDVASANVIGELRGREKPDEVVLIGAHLDSWDVGQGAHDDGAGCVQMMQAITVLRQLGLQPRRTIRVVLFTNEENGLRGGRAYAERHAAELGKMVLALEADSGGFAPRGFSVETAETAPPELAIRMQARLTQITELMHALGPLRVTIGHSGADIGPLVPAGVPALGMFTDGRTYFDIHHTEADTLDKVDPALLADGVAAVAALAYVVADMPDRLDSP